MHTQKHPRRESAKKHTRARQRKTTPRGTRKEKKTLAAISLSVYNYRVGVLYITATPIGNLGDITFRAVETLKTADAVACEDTRRTLQLLNHFDIRKPLISCRAQNERAAAQKIIGLLNEDRQVAYVSDAGTPGISDPGAVLVDEARKAGHRVVPVPGASAFAALASVAGSGGKTIVFEGFLSPKPGRRKNRLSELMEQGTAFVVYESPFRIVKLLSDISDIDSGRRVVVGRELTKLHEEILEGTAAQVCSNFRERERIQGEFAVFVSGIKNTRFSHICDDN